MQGFAQVPNKMSVRVSFKGRKGSDRLWLGWRIYVKINVFVSAVGTAKRRAYATCNTSMAKEEES